jgi:hypothetical protein
MDRDEYRAWRGRIIACDTLPALMAVRAAVVALPISSERFTLLLDCSAHRWRALPLGRYRR